MKQPSQTLQEAVRSCWKTLALFLANVYLDNEIGMKKSFTKIKWWIIPFINTEKVNILRKIPTMAKNKTCSEADEVATLM